MKKDPDYAKKLFDAINAVEGVNALTETLEDELVKEEKQGDQLRSNALCTMLRANLTVWQSISSLNVLRESLGRLADTGSDQFGIKTELII